MVRPRWHKVLTDLWINRTRSLLVIASITVGLFAMGTIDTIYPVISEDMRLGYFAANPPNIHIVVSSLFDQDVVKSVERVDGVRQAQGVRTTTLRLRTAPGEWTTINIEAIDPEKRKIGLLSPVQGDWPPGRHEIAIERYKFPDTNASLGDQLIIELPSGKMRSLKLVGLVTEQTLGAFSFGPGFFMSPIQGYVSQETLEWLEQSRPDWFNALNVIVEGDSSDQAYLQEVSERVRDELEQANVSVVSVSLRESYDHPNRIYGDALVGLLLLLGFLVLFLSSFLIINTLQALVNQQVQQIGIMKSVGARQHQVVGIYMGLVAIFSALSVAIAVPLAREVAFRIVEGLGVEMNFVFRGPRILPQVIAKQVVLGFLMPQLASFFPIWQGTLMTIQESLSGIRQNHPPVQDWLSRWITRWHWVGRPTRLALRNTLRSKGRLMLTLITLSLGGAVFISTFNVQLSLSNYVFNISRYFLADVNLTLTYPHRIERIQDELADVEGVGYVEGWGVARSELILEDGKAGDAVTLFGPPAGSRLVQPMLLSGRWLQVGDQNAIALNERFMSVYPDMQVGDILRLRVNGDDTEWRVIGFFQMAGKSSSFLAYTNYAYLSDLINQDYQASTFRVVGDQAELSEQQQKELGKHIEARLRERGIEISEIAVGQWLSETSSRGFSVLTGFLLFLAMLTAVVGGIGLAGTMSMNVMERTREIGVMRAVGASNRTLMRMVILEGTTIGLFSWLLACLLAFPISKAMSDQVSMALFGFPSNFSVTPNGFLIWLGIALGLSMLASFLPARSAARLTIREVLAYE